MLSGACCNFEPEIGIPPPSLTIRPLREIRPQLQHARRGEDSSMPRSCVTDRLRTASRVRAMRQLSNEFR